ncbi:MAG TPA: tRNA epoxyqueuosine(34) reductase QueG [Candidatus Limnocylindria bacterium]|jgi:epoxyqueuosine reductase|nr:tRNA epoxyqueuosine(34) reductase QueG [Candidatus Limnocylindria bacterium]
MNLKERIRNHALGLGFDDLRFTSAEPPASSGHFLRALSEGRHGEMAWLARNAAKRTDPNLVLPGVASVIVLAASYHRPGNGAQAVEGRGVLARYSPYTDYHEVLAEPLRQLAASIDEWGGSGTRSLWYVDTGPILERDLAQRAGLGFVGKHTNLISRRLGNWFFISEILTTAVIEPDPPEHNRCGHCTKCLNACPTQALPAPFTLDARRCISYLTIELKGSIPVELRPLIGNRIYGCDDCLAVCPWNRFAREGSLMRPHFRADLEQSTLVELLSLDELEFRRRFAGTPMLRTKRRGLLRNVCVALGNVGDTYALPALEQAASDREPLIAEHATWALAQIRGRFAGLV